MGFDIPMKTGGVMSMNALIGSNNASANTFNGNNAQQTSNFNQQSYKQNNYNQQQSYQQNNYNQQQSYQQANNYNQQQNYQQNNNYNQQQNYQQNNYNQQQSYQQNNNYTQPVQPKNHPKANGNVLCLKKGQKFALPQDNNLTSIRMGLGWDVLNQACDLDASVFLLDSNDKVIGDDWFVFYGQLQSPDGSVVHSGDSGGYGQGDDETITIDLNRVDQRVQKITFIVTINEALENHLNFSMVANAYVRIINGNNGQEIARFNLTDYYANVTSMVVGELYRYKGQWKFTSVGDGVAQDLVGLCGRYGINASY